MKVLIIGGNRFFGRHLGDRILQEGHDLTLLNRGNFIDGLKGNVHRLKADRRSRDSLTSAVGGKTWDIIFDQVCFSAEDAQLACEIFKNKTHRYIVTSTESVYDSGAYQHESQFDPFLYEIDKIALPNENYQKAKRQVESVFARSDFPEVVMVRPSLVVGLDDYSNRLEWHLDRITKGLPIFFPDLDVEADFIQSEQAGIAMKVIGFSKHTGPINCTSPGALSLRSFLTMCEKAVGKPAVLAPELTRDSQSPYGFLKTKTMDTTFLKSLNATGAPAEQWMESLMVETAKALKV